MAMTKFFGFRNSRTMMELSVASRIPFRATAVLARCALRNDSLEGCDQSDCQCSEISRRLNCGRLPPPNLRAARANER